MKNDLYSDDVLQLNPDLSATGKRSRATRSKYEVELEQALSFAGLMDGAETEYQFDADRDWRFDFAWPRLRIAAEVDGGNRMAAIDPSTGKPFAIGRHTQPDDYRKLNAAVAAGWRVYRFTPDMIRSGEAFATLQDALAPLPFTR